MRSASSQRDMRSMRSDRGGEHHPMGKLNVSSVRAMSDAHSVVASPEQNKRKELESHVFGSRNKAGVGGGSRISSVKGTTKAEERSKKLDAFLTEANETEEVNEMLIDAIKAKLAILDTMGD